MVLDGIYRQQQEHILLGTIQEFGKNPQVMRILAEKLDANVGAGLQPCCRNLVAPSGCYEPIHSIYVRACVGGPCFRPSRTCTQDAGIQVSVCLSIRALTQDGKLTVWDRIFNKLPCGSC